MGKFLKKIGGKNTVKDIIRVTVSNFAKLLSGILVGFILPKIIGVADYGFYKVFTLYATYVGMFHFGISDGIYLVFGGKDYDQLDKNKFRFYSRFFIIFEIVVAISIAIFSMFFFENEYKFIFLLLAIYLVVNNTTSYFQSISQITNRFKELSNRNILQSILISISVIILFGVHCYFGTLLSYRWYLYLYIFIFVVLSLWYIFTYKELVFGKSNDMKSVNDILFYIRIGMPLMISNLCSSLILTLDRQFVNILYNTKTYAIYAFSYNLLALVTTATSAISTVLYPKLKRVDEGQLDETYDNLIMAILLLVFACLLIYFPLVPFISWFLPKYSDSLVIFRIVFPGLAVSSVITIVMHNYYKAIGLTFNYFVKSVVVLIVSCLANYLAYSLFRTTVSISIASIITMIFWYLYVESTLVSSLNIKPKKNFIYMLIMMSLFYVVTISNSWIFGFLIYLCLYVIISYLFYRRGFLQSRDSEI